MVEWKDCSKKGFKNWYRKIIRIFWKWKLKEEGNWRIFEWKKYRIIENGWNRKRFMSRKLRDWWGKEGI